MLSPQWLSPYSMSTDNQTSSETTAASDHKLSWKIEAVYPEPCAGVGRVSYYKAESAPMSEEEWVDYDYSRMLKSVLFSLQDDTKETDDGFTAKLASGTYFIEVSALHRSALVCSPLL